MTEGTSQGLFIVVAIVIFGIFVSLSYTLFGKTLQPQMVNLFETSFEQVNNSNLRFRDVLKTKVHREINSNSPSYLIDVENISEGSLLYTRTKLNKVL